MRDHRHHHLAPALRAALLDKAFDGNIAVAQGGGDLGQHAGAIFDHEADIGARGPVAGLGGRQGRKLRRGDRERRAHFVAGNVDEVRRNRARRRPVARACALEQQPAGEIALGHHGVGGAVDRAQRVALGDEARAHALEQARTIGGLLDIGLADQPDDKAERVGLRDIGGAHLRDAAHPHAREIDPRAEADGREDRQLVRRVHAFDIEGRIGLGKAQPLRFGQHVAEVRAGALHRREDVIAGAVEDAVNLGERIGRGAFAQALDDRDAARHRRLELERGVMALGDLRQLQPVMRDHRLVGGDEALARAQRRARQRQRRAVRAADQLYHHVHVIAPRQRGHVVFPGEARDIDPAILAAIARGHRHHLDSPPGARGDQPGVGVQQPDHARADRAETGDRDTQGLGCGCGQAGLHQ